MTIRDGRVVRLIAMKLYRELRGLGDTPEKARAALQPIYDQLAREGW